MALLNDMRSLAQNLLQDYDARVEAIADLRTNTRQELKNYRAAHQALTVEQRRRLEKQKDDLHNQVNNMRQATATFLGDLDKSNQSMADELSLQLTLQRSRLATDTAAFINSISSNHQEMATQQAQERSAQSAKLHQNVKDLRHNAAAAHRFMAITQKQSRVQHRNKLIAEVTEMRGKLQIEQGAVRTDQAEAAIVWANIRRLKHTNRMPQESAPGFQAVKEAWKMTSPAEPLDLVVAEPLDLVIDDLEVIHGIGPGMAKHLYAAGFLSFAKLAASTPEQLREILGKAGKLATVETWITQAQDLI